jgi:hypothetical protein
MVQQYSLNTFYSRYKDGIIKYEEFEGLIFNHMVKNQISVLSYWKRVEYEDMLSWFYPRLRKVVDSYQITGSSFESYLNNVMRLAGKEYQIRMATCGIIEYSAWYAQVQDMYAYETEASYVYENQENTVSKIILEIFGKRKNKKQLLTLILKCYYYVSDDFIEKAACNTGISQDKLREMIKTLRIKRQKRDDKIYCMKEKIYSQFYKCIVLEKRISYLTENTNSYINLDVRLKKARKRLEKMRWRLTKIRTDATNREVADVIGVSKGCVDSQLHFLKSKWGVILDRNILN